MPSKLRIATRQSPLALWQAEHVKSRLESIHPDLQVELIGMTTKGDQLLDQPLAKIGGKGLFVKELEKAMLDGRADIAVHSMKDVGVNLPEEFHIPTIMQRENPFDAFVSNHYASFNDLPAGSVVGTSSLRRQCQLLEKFPQLTVRFLRGNVNTRLAKLDAGEYDAIILAKAGLLRLGMDSRIAGEIDDSLSLPAVGQGAIGIECLKSNEDVTRLLMPLSCPQTTTQLLCERAMSRRLNGSCEIPIGGFAVLDQDQIWLRGLVGEPDGSKIYRAELSGPTKDAELIGLQVAESLINQGANIVLDKFPRNDSH